MHLKHARTSVTLHLAVLGLFMAAACTQAAAPAPTSAPEKPTQAKPAEAKPAAAKPAAAEPTLAIGATADSGSLDQLFEKAKQEGGKLSLYGSLNPNTTKVVFAAFEKRFPGLKVEWVDGTSEKLVARIVAEARGGKVLVDVIQTNIDGVRRVSEQGMLLEKLPSEAAAYPDNLKGKNWLASDLKFYVAGWNTSVVSTENAPKSYEDLGDPKWKGKLIGDPGDVELLIALAKHKYQDDDKALDLLKRIAANNVEFHKGHSELAELLVGGQGAICITCFSHHFPPRIAKGAPVDYMLSEGVGLVSANGVFKDAPHPNTAWLWVRWVASQEGQEAYAQAGATPSHPNVPPQKKTRPEKIYPVGADDLGEFTRYEKLWKETFDLR